MRGFVYALQFLTRLSLGRTATDFKEEIFGRAVQFFPLVGLVIGLFLSLCYWSVSKIFPLPLTAALVLVCQVVLTGGMHLDGFMDTVDGLMSGRPAAEKLRIMRDSRIGAYAATGLFLLLLIKFTAIWQLPVAAAIPVLVAYPVSSRLNMAGVIALFPYARPEGLGRLFAAYTGGRELLVAAVTAAVVLLLLHPVCLLAGCLTWGAVYYWARGVCRELGGLTGDVYGAVAEGSEALFLVIFYLLFSGWIKTGLTWWW